MAKFNEAALMKILAEPENSTTLQPGPPPTSTTAKAALRRCFAAWQRAFNQCMREEAEILARKRAKSGGKAGDEDETYSLSPVFAARQAAPAYCNAMPVLEGYEGIRDFIACTAHGVLIGAITPQRSAQLLYAAQIALNAFQAQPQKAPTPRGV